MFLEKYTLALLPYLNLFRKKKFFLKKLQQFRALEKGPLKWEGIGNNQWKLSVTSGSNSAPKTVATECTCSPGAPSGGLSARLHTEQQAGPFLNRTRYNFGYTHQWTLIWPSKIIFRNTQRHGKIQHMKSAGKLQCMILNCWKLHTYKQNHSKWHDKLENTQFKSLTKD